MTARLKPIHPGEILREEFMAQFNLNPHKLAMELHVPAPGVYEIIHEERGISPEMALRLSRLFGTTPDFWLNLQAHYDLEIALAKRQSKVNREVRPISHAVAANCA